MIKITSQLSLQPIVLQDQPRLMQLMRSIYPPAYAHYWKDDCSWYLKEQYGIENLKQELNEAGSSFYFIQYHPFESYEKDTIIGILRLRTHCTYAPLADFKAFKVHRLYLAPSVQGKGIGRTLMNYASSIAQKSGHDLIWLDAMDTHQQAQSFYKNLGYTRTEAQRLPFELLHDEHRTMWYMHKML